VNRISKKNSGIRIVHCVKLFLAILLPSEEDAQINRICIAPKGLNEENRLQQNDRIIINHSSICCIIFSCVS